MSGLRILAAVATLLIATTAPVAAGPAGSANADYVSGGGWRLTPDGERRVKFTVNAEVAPGGASSGYYTFRNVFGTWMTGALTCSDVAGDHAVTGGWFERGDLAGENFLVFFIDGGDPVGGQAGPDIVSFTYVPSLGDSPGGDVPGDFPVSCPAADGTAHDNAQYLQVEGNIVVNDGSPFTGLWTSNDPAPPDGDGSELTLTITGGAEVGLTLTDYYATICANAGANTVVFTAQLSGTVSGDTLSASWISAKCGNYVIDVSGWGGPTYVYDSATDTLDDGFLVWQRM